MAKVVTAKAGETLCALAIRNGFSNCDKLRAEGANSGVLKEWLEKGDKVTIPDREEKKTDKPTDAKHKFKVKRRPEPEMRFVHGSKRKPWKNDSSVTKVSISNFKTDMAGSNGQAAFAAAYGFNQDAHDDPDTFKVELVSPDGGSPKVRLQAMKPVYKPDGSVDRHEEFSGAELAARRVDVDCQSVSRKDPKRYRSRYLRLVTDTDDQGAAPDQTLLVTDMADGAGGANDQVEILDQRVRATYELPGCKAGANKCKLMAELEVGDNKRRIRMTAHIFRAAPGGANIGGITANDVRRRVYKWFRRAYAQVNLAPKLIQAIDFFDPPSADMIAISNLTGTPASGVDGSGNQSQVRFQIGRNVSILGFQFIMGPTVRVNLTAGWTPRQVCDAIVAALPAGYSGTAYTNATSTNQATPCADVIIRKNDGKRVILRNESTTDTALNIDVARVDIANVTASGNPFVSLMVGTLDARRLMRFSGADNRLDMFVVGTIPGARGVAFLPASDLAAQYRPPQFLRWGALMRATVMNGADNDPFTFPHEAGHVLTDAFHVDATDPLVNTEMMTGQGTSPANAVGASKRIADAPVRVQHQKYNPAQATPGDWHSVNITPVRRFRTRGAPVYEAW
ncbi:hypothetical protein ACFLU6_01845 [Acidobacteriota bacterium]